jgi:hypothetical protein
MIRLVALARKKYFRLKKFFLISYVYDFHHHTLLDTMEKKSCGMKAPYTDHPVRPIAF